MRIAAAVILLAFAAPVMAEDDRSRWTAADTGFQLAFTGTVAIDWMQTVSFIRAGELRETNPLLGRHPSVKRANLLIGGAILGHAAIAYVLPQPWRRVWQVVGLTAELGAVSRNFAMGVHIKF